MLKAEQVPDEVAEAVMHCFHTRNAAKSAIAAALNAWPGMDVADDDDWCAIRKGWITLPQEASDE